MKCDCELCVDYKWHFEKEGRKLLLIVGDTQYTVSKWMRNGALALLCGTPWNCCPHRADSARAFDWEEGHNLASCPELAWQLGTPKNKPYYVENDRVLVDKQPGCVQSRRWSPFFNRWTYNIMVDGGMWEEDVPHNRLQYEDTIAKMGELVQ